MAPNTAGSAATSRDDCRPAGAEHACPLDCEKTGASRRATAASPGARRTAGKVGVVATDIAGFSGAGSGVLGVSRAAERLSEN